ncbi:MAG: caffeoyl-CoA O-methyltransferase, partial [Patiriisocius sp.]
VLSMISKLIRPLRILEIGTYTGYSALCLAEGMQAEGTLYTIDINEELYDFQRRYFDCSDFGNQIIQHTGNALEIIPKLEETFDLVFLDADKSNYPKYIETVLPKMNKGAVLLSDNVLWYGKVAEASKEKDTDTAALKQYNKMIHDHPQLESVLLPIRDGLTISRKI